MGVSPAVFESGGKRTEHYVPGSYSRSFNISSPSGISAGNLCILGKSTGGKPFELLEFGSVADAKEALVGGELLDAVGFAFAASNDFIPQRVNVMRVNNGTQATLMLKNGDTDNLKVKAWDYGVHTNQLQMLVADGTQPNTKKVTLSYKDKSETVDNIGKKVFSLIYFGDGQNPTVTINANSMVLAAESIPEGEEPSETIDQGNISFTDFDTMDALIAKINNSGVYQATLIDVNTTLKTNQLDTISSVPITDEGLTIYANYNEFKKTLESMSLVGEVEVESTDSRVVPENTDAFVYFTGGTSGDYTLNEWSTALESLETKDIQILATPSTEQTVHSLISNHCTSMSSTVNRKERTAILGGSVGMSDDAAITEAQGINNKLISFVPDNALAFNQISGENETISGAMIGCMLAGMESAMSPNTPLTFKTLNVLGFSKVRTITNLEKLIKAGLMVCSPNPENLTSYICIRAMTTYQSDDLINNERSMVREDLFMNRDLRQRFVPPIGGTQLTINEIIQTLKDAAKDWNTNGYIVPTDDNENVWDIKIRIDGDKRYLTFSRYLTAPVNFVFITAVNHIYTSTMEM